MFVYKHVQIVFTHMKVDWTDNHNRQYDWQNYYELVHLIMIPEFFSNFFPLNLYMSSAKL